MKNDFTQQETNAVLLYEGCGVPGEYDEFFQPTKAYQSLNLFLMEGQDGERVRICIEGQQPDSIYIQQWKKTLEVLETLFQVQCEYACQQKRKGRPLPNPLVRGDRKVNFDQMCAVGGTVAFTSTTKNIECDDFLAGKQDPHFLHVTLGEKVPYLDFEGFFGSTYGFPEEREVLLPPMVHMTHSDCSIKHHAKFGPVCHYNVTFAGFGADITTEDNQHLMEFLGANAADADEGLRDLVNNKQGSDIFQNEDHIYWKWKAAFRQLAMQRMLEIYKCYFG